MVVEVAGMGVAEWSVGGPGRVRTLQETGGSRSLRRLCSLALDSD